MKKNILFVCTGNTCRSPMIEYLVKEKAGEHFEVKSAGISPFFVGQGAALNLIQLFRERGIEVLHEVQTVQPELMEWADIILTVAREQKEILRSEFPEKEKQILTFKEYIGLDDEKEVLDPFGRSIEVYKEAMDEVEDLVNAFLQKELADK